MSHESTLTASEKDSLRIERFIFHIVIKGESEPRFLDEVRIEEKERSFFREMIASASEGTQFVFVKEIDGADPVMARLSKSIIEDESNFVTLSKTIATEFLRQHKGNVSNGVFLISVVSIHRNGSSRRLLSLIKVDHTRVLQFETEGATAILKELANTFVEDKNAIQKMALVDPSSTFAWDVLGSERRTSDNVAEYFKKFLGMEIRENAYVLTQRAIKALREWFGNLSASDIPEGENLSTYKTRAIRYLEAHDLFETDAFVKMVVRDAANPRRRKTMMASFRESLANAGIAGQSFRPEPGALRPVKRTKAKTSRGVQIIWDGDPSARGIVIPNAPDTQGKYHVTITSDEPLILE